MARPLERLPGVLDPRSWRPRLANKKKATVMSILSKTTASLCAVMAAAGFVSAAQASDTSPIKDGRIGYVIADAHFAVYQTPDGAKECPQGLNAYGPREIFKVLWPN